MREENKQNQWQPISANAVGDEILSPEEREQARHREAQLRKRPILEPITRPELRQEDEPRLDEVVDDIRNARKEGEPEQPGAALPSPELRQEDDRFDEVAEEIINVGREARPMPRAEAHAIDMEGVLKDYAEMVEMVERAKLEGIEDPAEIISAQVLVMMSAEELKSKGVDEETLEQIRSDVVNRIKPKKGEPLEEIAEAKDVVTMPVDLGDTDLQVEEVTQGKPETTKEVKAADKGKPEPQPINPLKPTHIQTPVLIESEADTLRREGREEKRDGKGMQVAGAVMGAAAIGALLLGGPLVLVVMAAIFAFGLHKAGKNAEEAGKETQQEANELPAYKQQLRQGYTLTPIIEPKVETSKEKMASVLKDSGVMQDLEKGVSKEESSYRPGAAQETDKGISR